MACQHDAFIACFQWTRYGTQFSWIGAYVFWRTDIVQTSWLTALYLDLDSFGCPKAVVIRLWESDLTIITVPRSINHVLMTMP